MADDKLQTDMSTREIYPRLLRYTFRYWHMFSGAVFGMALYAGLSTGLAYVLKPLLDGSLVERDPVVIKWIPFVVVGLFMARGIANFLSSYCMAWVSTRVVENVRSDIFSQYLLLPSSYFDQHASAKITTKLIYHTSQITGSATSALTITIKDGLTVIGLIGLMFYFNASLAVIIFGIGPIIVVLINIVSRRFRRYSRRIQALMGDLTHISEEVLTGRRVVKIFGGEDYENRQFEDINVMNRRIGMRQATVGAVSTPIIQTIAAIAVGIVVYLAVHDTGDGVMSPGEFAAFFGAMIGVMSPLKRLTGIVSTIQNGMAAAGSIFEFLDEPGEDQGGDRVIERAQGRLEFDQVSFRYPGANSNALTDISFTVEPGQTVAFVGRSGAGKSTLLTLLPRFYDPTGGKIVLDGHKLGAYQLRSLRSQISLVDQNVVLFNDTIARNIAYGSMEVADRDRIEDAARRAYAWEFIEALPNGLDTLVGQNGVMLSGGQRQRVAIARALLKNAPILILDEATSALDTESERAIQKGLENLMRDRTTLVIAHRLSTIQHADRIVVLHEGALVEQGSHEELMAQNGHYRSLHNLQFADPE